MSFASFNRSPTDRDLRIFFAILIPFSGFIAWWLSRQTDSLIGLLSVLAVGGIVGVLGLLMPQRLKWFYLGWMWTLSPINLIVTFLLMSVVFYGVVLPLGWLMHRTGRDALGLKLRGDQASYWERRRPITDPRRYFRQY